MADAQTECGEHGSDRQGSDERSRDGSRSDQGGDDRKDEDGKKDNKPGLLERYPIIRYVLIGALILGIVAAAFWYINYRQRGQYLQSTALLQTLLRLPRLGPWIGALLQRSSASE